MELELGRQLFNDPILSRNNDVSCATCHLANHGFADGNSLSVGALGKGGPSSKNVGRIFPLGKLSLNRSLGDDGLGFEAKSHMFRNTLSTLNVVYRSDPTNQQGLFHDGRFGSLFFQTLLPIHTSIEMCGDNPIPEESKNIFRKGGPFFKTPVKLTHANTFDKYQGLDTGNFNAASTTIDGIPFKRPNGTYSIPGRNECLAIAVAKVRAVKKYRQIFKQVYNSAISDRLIGVALAAFVSSHVSRETPYDRFVEGANSLSLEQLIGMVSFFSPLGVQVQLEGYKITGAGCFQCHNAPEFGGHGFFSLGVRSSEKSSLSRALRPFKGNEVFFGRERLQRGRTPTCHIEETSVSRQGYAPDIGRAAGSFQNDDCFKFRVPILRNVLQTYPYFHHGTERAQRSNEKNIKKRALKALENVILYHLRGPIDPKIYRSSNQEEVFTDPYFQKDFFIPYFSQNFTGLKENSTRPFPVVLEKSTLKGLINFIAFGLLDEGATISGDLGNDVRHPKKVWSGFSPSITRDQGTQLELPPNM